MTETAQAWEFGKFLGRGHAALHDGGTDARSLVGLSILPTRPSRELRRQPIFLLIAANFLATL